MVAVKKTKTLQYDTNLVANQTHIYVSRKVNANQIRINWKNKDDIYWSKYQIKETDMRTKTAKLPNESPPNYLMKTRQIT